MVALAAMARPQPIGVTMAKAKKLATATPAAPANVPVAHNTGPQGKASAGAHVMAWRGCAPLAPTATLAWAPGYTPVNPWRPHTPGAAFYTAVLAPTLAAGNGTATVQAVIAAGATAGLKAAAVQGHLRWLYTWGPWLTVNGLLYGQPSA